MLAVDAVSSIVVGTGLLVAFHRIAMRKRGKVVPALAG
jgi:hypothetical protein